MKNLKIFATILVVSVFITGCAGLKKMIKDYNTVRFDTTPKVLETNGGKIAVEVKGKIPPKYFHKKAIVDFTPELRYEGGSTKLKSITLKGEKALGDGIMIIKQTGGSFTYNDIIDYKPDMNKSELGVVLKAKLKPDQESVELGSTKLADGVIYTSERIGKDEDIYLAEHEYEKETILSEKANIYFEYNKYNFNKKLTLNEDQENSEKLKTLCDFIDKGWKIKNIDINAWASPEGEETLNAKLSENRSKTADKYLKDEIKNNIKETEEETPFNVVAKGEDFEGFMKALNASNIPDKGAIKNVIESSATKYEREQKIKDMTVIYQEIEDMLSVLRRSEISVYCYEPKKTDEEIATLSTTYPDSLDNKELLYAATLTKDLNTKLKIYTEATTVYPDNWKGYNNAGYVSLELGNVDDAISFLEKANTLSPNNGIILNNLGVADAYKKDYENAQSYYESAAEKGIDEGYNKGIILITKGDYAGALASFGDKKCTYNIALAQLLSKNPNGASETLKCAPESAESFYLMAIAGARTKNASMIYENLKKAIHKDPKYREQAKDDREFINYFDEADFQYSIK